LWGFRDMLISMWINIRNYLICFALALITLYDSEIVVLWGPATSNVLFCSALISRGGHAQLFFESAIAIPQLEGSTSAIAIPQLLKKCCSATATPQLQFFLKSATSSPELESFISAIFGTFSAVESGRFMGKKIRGKKSQATVPLRQVFSFQRNRGF
jgi:hypothetical protein